MKINSPEPIRKTVLGFVLFALVVSLCLGIGNAPVVHAQGAASTATPQPARPYFTKNEITLADGSQIEETTIDGPPTPPPGVARPSLEVTEGISAQGDVILSVPAYGWSFGCSATSGAMIAAYYDKNGYPNMYTGPTNGGVMPVDSSSWGTWNDGHGGTYAQCPLTASRDGLDGRTTRGSIDDYWVAYNSSTQDPYLTSGWAQHSWAAAIGDYMKTSQSAFGNSDGATAFYNWTSGTTPLTCTDMVTHNITQDGTYGRKLFYEARGYTVTDCYNQNTNNIGGGFTFPMYMAQIDAGRPVMVNLAGHTVVGIGYNSATNTIYIHDTWDFLIHSMTWGGSYSTPTMTLQSVSIVNLAPNSLPATTMITNDTPDPSFVRQSYTVLVAVNGSYGTPSGSVAITDGSSICTATLSGGTGSCSLASTTAGNKTLTATYSGSSTYASSTYTTTHVVNEGGYQIYLPVLMR